jgi:hypothetical protein
MRLGLAIVGTLGGEPGLRWCVGRGPHAKVYLRSSPGSWINMMSLMSTDIRISLNFLYAVIMQLYSLPSAEALISKATSRAVRDVGT